MAKNKILAATFTLFVIGLLIMSGPVEGLSLKLDANKLKVSQGNVLTFTAKVNIDSQETLPIDKLTLEMKGPETITCTFSPDGNPLDGCDGIIITKLNNAPYGYGYGYGYGYQNGELSYKVELNTKGHKTGIYTTELKIKSNDSFFSTTGKTITIKPRNDGGDVCAPEWVCADWSECSNNVQTRTCYRNINYCEIEEMPAESRVCLLDDGQNFDQSITLNNPTQLQEKTSFDITSNGFSDGLRFIIILLLMNCIITTMNIIVKVQARYYRILRIRRFKKKMSSIKKAK
jgi:hypothetical protein